MPRATLIFDRHAGGSWLPTTVILATPDHLEGRCLPGDENRDGRLARLLHHAVPPRIDVNSWQRGAYEDWIDWGLDHLANGHTTWMPDSSHAHLRGAGWNVFLAALMKAAAKD